MEELLNLIPCHCFGSIPAKRRRAAVSAVVWHARPMLPASRSILPAHLLTTLHKAMIFRILLQIRCLRMRIELLSSCYIRSVYLRPSSYAHADIEILASQLLIRAKRSSHVGRGFQAEIPENRLRLTIRTGSGSKDCVMKIEMKGT